MNDRSNSYCGNEIAIVGMACRMPGANNIDEFWDLIQNGEEHITFLSEKQLRANGVLPERSGHPNYIPARGTMDDVELFDAEFFGISPMEAKYMDPQQRWFLETSWTALEHAGYCSSNFHGRIGVYAGAAWNSYLLNNLASHANIFNSEAAHIALLGNDKDHLSTRVSYKLDLNGAAITIQTACSSSLVAVALACQSLRLHENDIAIAGGVSITAPVGGYTYRSGGSLSNDGHCRPFDDLASGTVIGDGVGIVVLRRLEDAVKSNDTIYGVIRSCAVNNDGARKMGYTAPGIPGQAEAILEALAEANTPADTIGYVEAHGTGTILGDPIEVAALTQAFRKHTHLRNYCAIGSVKANIGHLDAASGVSGLIKAVLSLRHRKIPPSVNFSTPNSRIDFENSPFYINTELKQWSNGEIPRRAAVSSFGLGGTNAHVVVEEWLSCRQKEVSSTIQDQFTMQENPPGELVILSGKTKTALRNIARNLHEYFRDNRNVQLEDIAYTLQVGRKSLRHRAACICNDMDDLRNFLESIPVDFGHAERADHSTNSDQRIPGQPEIERKISKDGWQAALDDVRHAWLSGLDLNWGDLREHNAARRIPLPTYPFERKRYWIDPATKPQAASSSDIDTLVDLLKNANSDLILSPGMTSEKIKDLNKKNSLLDQLAAGYMMDMFYKLGCFTMQESRHRLEDILRICNVGESYKQLLADWLELLSQKGVLSKYDAHTYQANNAAFPGNTTQHVLQEVLNKWTGDQQVIDLIVRCGEALPKIIRQTTNPLELFASVIDAAPTTETFPENLLLEQLTKLLTHSTNSNGLKLLEIGGGTGIAATKVLPLLQHEHSYHFTDLNPYFVRQAKKRFGAFPNVTFQVLDIEKTPESQGCSTGIYDIVLAVNVLHTLPNVPGALAHIKKLLRPGGILISWELTEATLDFAMTYGLLMSPIQEGMERSQGKPFLSVEQWRCQLEDSGFHEVNAYPESLELGQSIIIAASNEAKANHDTGHCQKNTTKYRPEKHINWSPALTKKADIDQWAYSPTWRRITAKNDTPLRDAGVSKGYWLLFMDKEGVGGQLAELARLEGEDVISIYAGNTYARNGTDQFFINSNCKEDFERLANELDAGEMPVTHIIHLFTFDYIQEEIPNDVAGLLEESKFLSLIYLVQVFGQRCALTLKRIAVVVPEANNVIGEEIPEPLHSMVGGFCTVIGEELPGLTCFCADLPRSISKTSISDMPLRNLYKDLVEIPAASTIAYRGSQRWVRAYEPFALESPRYGNLNFKKGGVYLITGGLGQIGMSIAMHLAQVYSAKLILLTRKELPGPGSWTTFVRDYPDHPNASILEKLLQVKEAASAVMVSTTDVCDPDQVKALSIAVDNEFGSLNGIIHAAGILGDGGIAQKTLQDFGAVLSPKIIGYHNLERVFDFDRLDFVVLFSSLSSVLPGFGQSAYSSANCYIDAVADRQVVLGKKNLYSINWDVWQGEGMAYDAKTPEAIAALKTADFNQRGILPGEGVEVFSRVIHSGRARVMICTSEYLKSSEFERNKVTQLYMDALEGSSQEPSLIKLDKPFKRYNEEIEEFLVDVWKELLEIDHVSPGDKFIDLGGDSLIGMQLISRIQGRFGVMLPAGIVYADCTIPKLCSEIKTKKSVVAV